MSLYAWREVLSWIRDVLGTDPDEGIDYLSDAQIASLNADLTAIKEERSEWHPISAVNDQIIADVQLLCQQPRLSLASLTTDAKPSDAGTFHKRLPVELQ